MGIRFPVTTSNIPLQTMAPSDVKGAIIYIELLPVYCTKKGILTLPF